MKKNPRTLSLFLAVLMLMAAVLGIGSALADNTIPPMSWSKTVENINYDKGTETYEFTLEDTAQLTFTLKNTRSTSSNKSKISISSIVGNNVGKIYGFYISTAYPGETETTTYTFKPDTYTVTVDYACGGYEFEISGHYIPSTSITSLIMVPGSVYTIPVSRGEDLTCTWESSNTDVVTVSAGGEVSAVDGGEATVTGSFSDGTTITVKITVVSLIDSSASLEAGETEIVGFHYLPSKTPVTYTSSDPYIASVDEKGYVKAVAPGKAYITAQIENCIGTLTEEITVKDVSLSSDEFDMSLGGKTTLKLLDSYSSVDVQWSSDDQTVIFIEEGAFLHNQAELHAVGPGTTTVRAVLSPTFSLTATVTVEKPKMNVKSLKMKIGQEEELSLSGVAYDARKNLTWSSSNTKVVKLGKSYFDEKRDVEALTSGSSVVTVFYEGNKVASVKVTVAKASLSPKKMTIGVKASKQLEVKGLYKYAKPSIKWTSSNKKIAAVSKDGKVTGKSAGTAKISASINGGKKITVPVTVIPAISAKTEDVAIGETLQLKVNGAGKNKVTWASSDPAVAAVTDKGLVSGNRYGTVTITAKCGKTTMKCQVTVQPKVVLETVRVHEESIYNRVYINFHNYSRKAVVYVRFNILQYDNAGHPLRSPYDWFYLNETISPRSVYKGHYYWVNDDTKQVQLVMQEVTFADGTKWRP